VPCLRHVEREAVDTLWSAALGFSPVSGETSKSTSCSDAKHMKKFNYSKLLELGIINPPLATPITV
jgi:hypothetical protein